MNKIENFNIKNKVVIITGTSKGIGYELARGFLHAGAIVHGISRSGSNLINFNSYIDHKINLEEKEEINFLMNEFKSKYSNLEILINCAGVSYQFNKKNFNDFENYFKNTMDLNFYAPLYLSYKASELMKENKKGSIINVTSIGSNLGFPENPAYISSKSALSGLTRSLSYDFAPFNIRVNNLVPGYFKTDMTKKSFDDSQKYKERSSRTLLKRWGETKELVGPAIFLASDASSYITGIDLIVDGGWSVKGL